MNEPDSMKPEDHQAFVQKSSLTTELLIMPDGQILVHNLTQPFAELLARLNPECEQIVSRITHHAPRSHEFQD